MLSFPSFHCQNNQSSQFALLLQPDDTTHTHSSLLASSLNDTQTLERRAPSWHLVGSSIPPSSPLVVNLHVVTSSLSSCSRFPVYLRSVTHSASMHSSFVATCLVYCVLTARYRRSAQLGNQPTTPPRTRQRDQSTTHLPTDISSITALLSHSYSRPTIIRSNLSAPPTFQRLSGTSYPSSRRSRPHFHCAPRPTRRRRIER